VHHALSMWNDANVFFIIITSAREFIFAFVFVCQQDKSNFDEIFWEEWEYATGKTIRFLVMIQIWIQDWAI